MDLKPSQTTIYVEPTGREADAANDGWSRAQWKVIRTEIVEPGDVVLLRPSDRIPADGYGVRDQGHVNESTVTGESQPVDDKNDSLLKF